MTRPIAEYFGGIGRPEVPPVQNVLQLCYVR